VEQIPLERTKDIHNKLRDKIKGPGLKLKLHNPLQSFMEGVFARGDRALIKVIMAAYEKGCRFDAWDDQFQFDKWMGAFSELGVDPTSYLRERSVDENLPWNHLFVELDKNFLLSERKKAFAEEQTPDCSRTKCSNCGICDFETVKPVMAMNKDSLVCHCEEQGDETIQCSLDRHVLTKVGTSDDIRAKYTIHFSKTGEAIYIGHLDFMNIFRRAFRRARLPLKFSEGYNKRPKISFASPLPVGIESLDEWCGVVLTEEMKVDEILEKLTGVFPPGIEVFQVDSGQMSINDIKSCVYICHSKQPACHCEERQPEADQPLAESDAAIQCPLDRHVPTKVGTRDDTLVWPPEDDIIITKKTKKGPREINLKDSIVALKENDDHGVEVELKVGSGLASIADVAKWLFNVDNTSSITITKRKIVLRK